MVDLQLEPPLTESGHSVTVLFEVLGRDNLGQIHRCRSAIRGTKFDFNGQLPAEGTCFLAVDANIQCGSENIVMQMGEEGKIYHRPPLEIQNALKIIETCSGIGCLGSGLTQIGFEVVLKHDINHMLLHLATKVNPGPTLQGDICSNDSIHEICQRIQYSCSLAAGVSCQPHSKLGDKRGQNDPRSATLPMTLRMGFLTRQMFIVLECVEDIINSEWAQKVLRDFCTMTGYKMTQGSLHLHHVWVSRRSRWWCILSHPMFTRVKWEPFPIFNPPPIVADVLDNFKSCTEEELKALRLDSYEMGKFGIAGVSNNLVPWKGQAKTCLHSCGNQVTCCPCGCRKYPFHEDRLQSGGIHGHLIQLNEQISTTDGPMLACRHIHPAELALLNGVAPTCDFGNDLKLALCAIGQLASPLQSAWLGSHILNHMDAQGWIHTDVLSPKVTLYKVMEHLLEERDVYFGVAQKPNTSNFKKILRAHLLGEDIHQPLSYPKESVEEEKIVPRQNKGKGGKILVNQKTETVIQDKNVRCDQTDETPWECNYQACPVCNTEESAAKTSEIIVPPQTVRKGDHEDISPTISFAVDADAEILASVDDVALTAAVIRAEQSVVTDLTLQEFHQSGGVIGFSTGSSKRRKVSMAPNCHESEEPKNNTRKGLSVAEDSETKSVPSNEQSVMSHQKVEDETSRYGCCVLNSHSSHPITIVSAEPIAIADILRAESLLEPTAGPHTAWTCVDTPLQSNAHVEKGQFVKLQHFESFRQHKCPLLGGNPISFEFPLTRDEALWQQGPWVADDEMEYYLQSLTFHQKAEAFKPLVVHATKEDQPSIEKHDEENPILQWISTNCPLSNEKSKASAFLYQNHWFPILLEFHSDIVKAVITPEGSFIEPILEHFAKSRNCRVEIQQKILPQAFPADCGFQAFAWLVATASGSWEYNHTEHLTPHQASGWRRLFNDFITKSGKCKQSIYSLEIGGMKHDEIFKQTCQLLKQHGVFEDRIEERANQVCSKIPSVTLKGILAAPRAWSDLKQAANAIQPPLRLIQSDELQKQIVARTNGLKHVGRKNNHNGGNRSKDQSRDTLDIQAADIEIPVGVFKQADGQLLGQVTSDQVGPNSSGMIVIDQQTADPTLRLPRPVTQKGLAAIVIATKTNHDMHTQAPIRFPAMCRQTQEPIIIAGYVSAWGPDCDQK